MRAGKEDVAQILDDLGSLSDPMRLGQPGAQPPLPLLLDQIWHPSVFASHGCCQP